jgi:hypothetical protein
MYRLVSILCLLVWTFSAHGKTWVHTPSLPQGVQLPADSQDYLYLEGETQSEATKNDVLPDEKQKSRTVFRDETSHNDKWWAEFVNYDQTRFATRGTNKDYSWCRFGWNRDQSKLASGVYDAYVRIYVNPGGSCDVVVNVDGAAPENGTTTEKENIHWVSVGSIQITDDTKRVQLHVRTKKSSICVDTVLLVKVQPKQVSVHLERFDMTPPDWHKGKGMVFARDSATLGYRSDAPEHIKQMHVATRLKLDTPGPSSTDLQWQSLAAQSDGTWAIPLAHPGWYDVHVRALLEDGRELTDNVTVAVVGKPISESRRKQSVFGIWSVYGDVSLIKLAGAYWNRSMTSLYKLTQEQVSSDPVKPAAFEPYAEENGLAYTGVFSFGLPMWAMQLPEGYEKPKMYGNPFFPARDWDEVSRCVAAFARNVRALPLIMEMYNEPLAVWRGTPAQLVEYARAVRKGLKSVNPNFKLIGPCLYSIRLGDLATLAEAGIFEELDGIVMHTYVDGTEPEGAYLDRIIELKAMLKQYGQQDKPLYYSEFGWTTADGTWQPPVDVWTQTRYVARSMALAWSQGVDGMAYFCLKGRHTNNAGEDAFPLFDLEDRPKPGYVSFAAVSKWFAGSKPLGHYQLTPTVHMVVGRLDGQLQISLWSTSGTEDITLPFTITRAIDMFGKALNVSADRLPVSQDPIYIEALDQNVASLPVQSSMTVMQLDEIKQNVFWPLSGVSERRVLPRPGDYAAFIQVNDQWQILPVKLVTPLSLVDVKACLPAGSDAFQIQATVQSNQDQTLDADLWLDDAPDKKVTLTVPAHGIRQVMFAQPDAIEARQHTSIIKLQWPQGKVQEQPLTWTALSAQPESQAVHWADFTDWAPFGKIDNTATFTDCRAKVYASYSDKGLRIQVHVQDDEHHQAKAADDPRVIWAQDSIQVALDMDALKPWQAGVVGSGLAGHRVFEFSIGGSGDAATPGVVFCNRSYDQARPVDTLRPQISAHITRQGDVTLYDVLIPWDQVGVDTPMQRGDVIGLALVVNDVDPERNAPRHCLRLFKGIAVTKDAKLFGRLWLR